MYDRYSCIGTNFSSTAVKLLKLWHFVRRISLYKMASACEIKRQNVISASDINATISAGKWSFRGLQCSAALQTKVSPFQAFQQKTMFKRHLKFMIKTWILLFEDVFRSIWQ